MAKLIKGPQISGTIGGMSFIKRWDSDDIYVREPGGPSREEIKNGDNFALSRNYQGEFGNRSSIAKYVNIILRWHKSLKDFNFTSRFQPVFKEIQALDTTSVLGERNVYFSRGQKLLEGFSLNRRIVFESIIRGQVPCTIIKEEGKVQVTIPGLTPGINLFVPGNHAAYSIVLTAGLLPDFIYSDKRLVAAIDAANIPPPVNHQTEWVSCQQATTSQVITLQLNRVPADSIFSIMVAIGIAFGTLGPTGEMKQVKRAGASKILCVS